MKILIGIDFSNESLNAARQGFAMAEHMRAASREAEVHVAYIEGSGAWRPSLKEDSVLEDPDNRIKIEAHIQEFLQENLDTKHAEALNYTLILEEGRARKKLPQIAERIDADWLFVGRSGSGALVRMTLGSTSFSLANAPPCNLAIAHDQAPDWQQDPKIAVGIDFSESSHQALDLAIDLAQQTQAHLHLIHVIFPAGPVGMPNGSIAYAGGDYIDVQALRTRAEHDLKELMDARRERLEGLQWHSEVLAGYPKREMVQYASEQDVDAIILGTVGRSALSNFLLGSVASGVVKHSPCTVYLSTPAA